MTFQTVFDLWNEASFYFSSMSCLNEEFTPSSLHVRWRVETLQEAGAFSNLDQLRRGFSPFDILVCFNEAWHTFFLLLL